MDGPVESAVSSVKSINRLPRTARPRIRIGEILLQMGAVTEGDLRRILSAQAYSGEPFGKVALALQLVTEEQLRQALIRQFSYPVAKPGQSSMQQALVTAYKPTSPYAEQLRTLRSQLLLRWTGAHSPTLAVMSARAGDGCSCLAANLAVVFAQLGERTLLVDADLRNPIQHTLFGTRDGRGITDLLKGECRSEDALQRVEPFDCLDVLSAGTRAPNPQELLTRPPFGHLLDEMCTRYDVVIIDTPPFFGYADAQIIASRVSGCLIGARRDATRMSDIAQLRSQLMVTSSNVLGVVISG